MFERQSRRVQSTVSSFSSSSNMNIGADLAGDPVFLKGKVIPSVSFARAMITLGKVVRMSGVQKKDRTEYQRWVQKVYLEELERITPDLDKHILAKKKKLTELEIKAQELSNQISAITYNGKFVQSRKEFWNWLYNINRDAWIVLDPIVSVQADGTFFEAFSTDESVYARVFLPHSAISTETKPTLGTTNIDYGMLLDREFKRTRSYRPVNLQVGLDAVSISTAASDVIEERIPLPETWVQGLVEVQSVLALAQTTFTLQSDSLADIIARLESERETEGPRSLKFHLIPGQYIRVEIEPWNVIYKDEQNTYLGESEKEIRIWGRRRLSVLKDLLVQSTEVKVTLLGSGMPSFWTVVQDGVELTIGLSGWTSNDWASKAKFSGFLPTVNISETDQLKAEEVIKQKGSLNASELATELSIKTPSAAAILQSLCLAGKAMFDPNRNLYRWRDLFPGLNLKTSTAKSPEETAGLHLYATKEFKLESDQTKNKSRFVTSTTKHGYKSYETEIEFDLDGRPKYAECTCSFFRYNKLKAGPCRHLVATTLKLGEL